jgi:hypothetical protein
VIFPTIYEDERKHLFLDVLYDATEDERKHLFLDVLYDATDARGKGITSLFVRRSIYFAFFGRRVPDYDAQ